jgi:hypothetical protein
MIKKEAAFRMLDSFKPNTGDMQGPLKIYEDFKGVMDLHALSEKTPIRYDFEAPIDFYFKNIRKGGMEPYSY